MINHHSNKLMLNSPENIDFVEKIIIFYNHNNYLKPIIRTPTCLLRCAVPQIIFPDYLKSTHFYDKKKHSLELLKKTLFAY